MQSKTGFARILVLSVSFLALTACGGGDSSPPFVCNPPGCTLTSQAGLDGAAASDNSAEANDQCPFTGDRESLFPGLGVRQFYSFDISSIPATATVTSATLRLYQALVLGDPYTSTSLGNVIVDHVDYGPSLDGGDYNVAPLAPIGTLSSDTVLEYKTLDVTSRVLDDITNARTRSQYRTRFSLQDFDSDFSDDLALFTDAEDACLGTGQRPQLVITLAP